MKKLLTMIAAVMFAVSLADSAAAQKKPKKTPVKKPVVLVAPLDVRAAREKTDIQLSNVNDYLARSKIGSRSTSPMFLTPRRSPRMSRPPLR